MMPRDGDFADDAFRELEHRTTYAVGRVGPSGNLARLTPAFDTEMDAEAAAGNFSGSVVVIRETTMRAIRERS